MPKPENKTTSKNHGVFHKPIIYPHVALLWVLGVLIICSCIVVFSIQDIRTAIVSILSGIVAGFITGFILVILSNMRTKEISELERCVNSFQQFEKQTKKIKALIDVILNCSDINRKNNAISILFKILESVIFNIDCIIKDSINTSVFLFEFYSEVSKKADIFRQFVKRVESSGDQIADINEFISNNYSQLTDASYFIGFLFNAEWNKNYVRVEWLKRSL